MITVFVGFYISKRASKDLDSYFLGGKSIPWYVLGISNASGMFDITGTMWLVYTVYVYGLKGAWIPWIYPMFNQIFLMVYLSGWLRRSNVLTGAEWIKTRFGDGRGAHLSHIIVVVFAVVGVIGFLSYGFKGIGKFASVFLPFDLSPNTYGLIFMGITTLYVVKGGMFSVVFTELLQFFVMLVASIAVGIIAINAVSPEAIAAVTPSGWDNLFFNWHLDLNWKGLMDAVDQRIIDDGWNMFGFFFVMMLFKGILVSAAGPAPNFDMQRILSARSPSEAAKMSGIVNIVLLFPRYFLIAGLTVLALVFMKDDFLAMGSEIDFEMILPYTVRRFLPVGIAGLLIAGLLAAFMSTFAATVNAAPAYLVNDIYKKYINPNAPDKTYVRLSYLTSVLVVVVGISFGFMAESINSVTLWIVSGLWGGYTASNVLKWYWWRFNGFGYFWGMTAGILASLIMPVAFPGFPALEAFPIVLAVSLLGSYLGSLMTAPVADEVLMDFYENVRPWGFWKPVLEKCQQRDPSIMANANFKRDLFNVIIGMAGQMAITVLPIYLVIQNWGNAGWALAILVAVLVILKKTWYDRLDDNYSLR